MRTNKYERKSFLHIFLWYLVSVTAFILLLGYLYVMQQKVFILQTTAIKMHSFLMQLHQSNFTFKQDGFSYEIAKHSTSKMKLPYKENSFYVKVFNKMNIVKVDSKIVDEKINKLITFTISMQVLLIAFFTIISWILAKKSIKPMVQALSHLDNFTKDLIHDLNTPISSILVNAKMLKKNANEDTIKKIERIEQSAKNIASLYDNLDILLGENILSREEFNLTILLREIVGVHKDIYPNIKFTFDNEDIFISSNQNAVKRIIDNIIQNSCKYSKEINPTISITYHNNALIIEDNGKGIKYPKKIFQRSYKENDSGYGIGMHIVHRLCSELDIFVEIDSQENIGTRIVLGLS